MMRVPPPMAQCHGWQKGFTNPPTSIAAPRMQLGAIGASQGRFHPVVKRFGHEGGKALAVALGQGERLGEALNFWLSCLHRRGFGGGGGRNGGGDGNGGGGGGGDSNLDPGVVEILGHREGEGEEEEQVHDSREYDGRLSSLAKLDSSRDYLCSDIEVVNVEGMELMEDEEFLGFMPGTRVNKFDIMEVKKQLMATGWYKAVNVRWVAESEDAIKLIFITEDAVYSNLSSFQCVSEDTKCLLPRTIQRDITTMLRRETIVTKETLSDIQDRIEDWYRDQGYVYAKVKGFRTSESGVLECNLDEGRISRISVSCEDEAGQSIACYSDKEIIMESLPWAVREGMQWNSGAGQAALKRVEQLGLFDKVNIELAASDSDCGDREPGIALHLRLKESPQQSADVNTEWSFLCNDAGRPDLRTLQPGGSLCVNHRNINGLNRTVSGCVTTSNLLRPEEDLRFKLEYVHPLMKGLQCLHPRLEGLKNLPNHTLRLLAFNKRKLSATYYDVDPFKEVPAVWIDRAGIKASVIEKLSEQSKVAYGVVVEEVATRDDVGPICKSKGSNGSTGIDHIAFLQMKLTRSNLKNGETGLIGARDIFQVDQGVGLGTRAPLFNRHHLAMTRYINVRNGTPEVQLPTVVVLHARYGGCVGDVVNYRSFSNGGPYALRGNNIGELAGFSRVVEVAGEVRFPLQQQMEGYCFVDSLTSLQNFGAICNKPGRLVERVGKGLMYGAGIKMGNVRIEYVIECNDQAGSLKVYTGERY